VNGDVVSVGTVSYLEAWQRWFAGQEIDPQLRLWFMSILWWGRVGKIATFIGGLTIILDLVGAERLQSIGKHPSKMANVTLAVTGAVVVAFTALYNALPVHDLFDPLPWYLRIPLNTGIFAAVGGLGGLVLQPTAQWLARKLGEELAREKPAQGIRIAAAGLVVVGFHFDLLSS
jgi:hypothetical protein